MSDIGRSLIGFALGALQLHNCPEGAILLSLGFQPQEPFTPAARPQGAPESAVHSF
jgi:hypothetical protein